MTDHAMTADLTHIGLGSAGRPTETAISADGTHIAFERTGDGPPVILMGGALNNKAMYGASKKLLSAKFTVINYDRRGRGESGDSGAGQYTIDREIEDLEAVIAAAGAPCFVFANCTGGMIAINAAARGVPMVKLAMYEPPYAAPQTPDDFLDRLNGLIADDRRSDAVSLFQREFVGFPDEVVAGFRNHQIWGIFEDLAPTLVYDCTISIHHGAIPFELLPKISVPTLVIDGGDSPEWQRAACETLAREIPRGRHHRFPGESHIINQESAAPLLTDFFLS